MGDVDKFSEEIKKRLTGGVEKRREKMREVSSEMERMLKQKENFEAVARDVLVSVVRPRMEALARNFENSTLDVLSGDIAAGFHSACSFAHTERFPATVSVEIVLFQGRNYENLDVHYSLSIFPMLMKFRQRDEMLFPLKGNFKEEVGGWVEGKILEFLDDYLKLESHPLYQKENLVVDPVCGMMFPAIDAASVLEYAGGKLYFCSDACKREYLKGRSAA